MRQKTTANRPKFIKKDIARSKLVWWKITAEHLKFPRDEYRNLIRSGLRNFAIDYYDGSRCSVTRQNLFYRLIDIKMLYIWTKSSFDGGNAYKETDKIINSLARISKLANQLATECQNLETFYLIGDAALNLEKLKDLSDSNGVVHANANTFFGGLMARVCWDSTVLADGLSCIRERNPRQPGRPPVVSKNYLMLAGMDLYENTLQLGPIRHSSPKNPTKPEHYSGQFVEFLDRFTALIADDDFKVSKMNTGFGSTVGKLLSKYREDNTLPKRLNPNSDERGLLLSLNELASLT